MKGKIHSSYLRSAFPLLFALLCFVVGSRAAINQLGSSYNYSSSALRVTASGSYAYVTYDRFGAGYLQIVDISDPANPVEKGRAEIIGTGFWALSITINGEYAYVATRVGLQIVNIANKAQPQRIKSISGDYLSADLVGNRLYVAGSNGGGPGLFVYDVADPANPALVGSYADPAFPKFLKVVVQNGVAFVGTDANGTGMLTLDVADPSSISRIGSSGGFGLSDLQVKGRYAFGVGSSGFSYFAVYDVGNPVSPTLVYSTRSSDPALVSIALEGETAVVSGHPLFASVYDISIPTAPRQTGILKFSRVSSMGTGVASAGNNKFIAAAAESGVRVLDVGNPAAPATVGAIPFGYAFASLVAMGDYLLVGDQIRGVDVIDVSEPSTPKIVRSVAGSNGGDAFGGYLSASSNRLALVSGNSLDVFDISNPAVPVLLGSTTNNSRFSNVKIAGSMAYTLDVGAGVRVFDISDPAHISIKSTFPITNCTLIDIIDHYLFVGGNGQPIRMLDISNSANLVSLDVSLSGRHFRAYNLFLYVSKDDGLRVYGISDSSTLVLQGFFPVASPGAYHAAGGDGYAVIVKSDWRTDTQIVELVDLVDVAHPGSDGDFLVYGQDRPRPGMVTQGNRVFALGVAENISILSIFEVALSHPARPRVNILLNASGVVLHWPDSFADYKLYSSTTLAGPWDLVISNPSREGANFSYTNRFAVAPKLFYKLIK